jgi:soluble lytic murein transglycosylase-like protein
LIVIALFAGLSGCSGGGMLPNGPHSMDSASLLRLVHAEAARNRVSPALLKAVITVESHGDPSAVSSTGAAGLMQLMPGTAALYGVTNPYDPAANVAGGCRYLHDLLARYHNNVPFALAAYNAGPGAVDASHGIPPFRETRAYVARVTAALHSTTTL